MEGEVLVRIAVIIGSTRVRTSYDTLGTKVPLPN